MIAYIACLSTCGLTGTTVEHSAHTATGDRSLPLSRHGRGFVLKAMLKCADNHVAAAAAAAANSKSITVHYVINC